LNLPGFTRMRLSQVIQDISRSSSAPVPDFEIEGLAYDSRKVQRNFVFAAIKGEKTDGNLFVEQAAQRGAVAILSENTTPAEFHGCWVQVQNARQALATAAANFFGRPTEKLDLIGITGTNGKTSTAYLIESILLARARVGVISTIEYRGPQGKMPADRTTPESLDLQALFRQFVEQGCRYVVMEVSSHALAMERVHCCQFRSAVFTNLTRDHLDYHQTLESYFDAKKRLFLGTGLNPPQQSILNRDDPRGADLERICSGRCLTYSTERKADVELLDSRRERQGTWVRLRALEGELELQTRLLGKPNVSNLLAAVAVGLDLGVRPHQVKQGIEDCQPIPGRFEAVDCGQPFHVFVDYAHTPDALEKVLQTARELAPKRLLALFGCGGERDRSKRPAMGKVADGLSDFSWITSDNPRGEDPLRIISEIESGFQTRPKKYHVEPDRRKAIQAILRHAKPGDIVVVAGKGHETYQILADRTIHFDDREETRLALREMGATS
jgi:UDP-N-acetylmuramoyl-L-alanyl-D-glutamate--2,6-diaminopimelate ligase